MISVGDVPKAFDTIAPAYDETREPLEPETLRRTAERLRERGVDALLEVGVGTGRIAAPLRSLGFRVTGVDASLGMMARAREKGLDRLVRGSAYRLPFADASVDATLLVHVLHLLDPPLPALREAARVGRQGAFALVHPDRGDRSAVPENGPRRLVFRYLAEHGYPLPGRGGGPPERERALVAQFPPDELTVVADHPVTEPLARRLDSLARRANRATLHVPPEAMQEAVAAARAQIGDRTVTYRRVLALARWSADRLRETPSEP